MADSAFWRDMEARFRALFHPSDDLRADGDYIIGSNKPSQWQLAGGLSPSVRVRFESLARQAGTALDDPDISDPLVAWLEALRWGSGNFQFGLYYVEQHADGSKGAHHQNGTISRLCEASADYCAGLESRAFQVQRAVGLTLDGSAEQTARNPPPKSRRGRNKGSRKRETEDLEKAIRQAKKDGEAATVGIVSYLARRQRLRASTPLPNGWRDKYSVKNWHEIESKVETNRDLKRACTRYFSKVKKLATHSLQ